jgi:hypothetical protein
MEPQHEPTTEEETASPERIAEEDAQRYPGHEAPGETTGEPDPDAA